jgi:hypothetical protein
MIKTFMAITLNGSERFDYTPSDSTIFQSVTMVSGVGEGTHNIYILTIDTEIRLFGETRERKYLICRIGGATSKRVSLTLNEDNFHTLYCVGTG